RAPARPAPHDARDERAEQTSEEQDPDDPLLAEDAQPDVVGEARVLVEVPAGVVLAPEVAGADAADGVFAEELDRHAGVVRALLGGEAQQPRPAVARRRCPRRPRVVGPR